MGFLETSAAIRRKIMDDLSPEFDRIGAMEAVLFAARITGLVAAPQPVEFGSTGVVRVDWSVTYAPAAFRLAGVRYPANARSANLPAPWTADRAVKLELLDVNDTVIDERTIIVYARVPVFAGVSPYSQPTPAEIRAAAYKSLDSASVARTIQLNRSAGGRPFFIFPAALMPATLKLGGFAVTGWTVSDAFDLVLATGAPASMRMILLDPLPASPTPLGAELA